MGKHKGCAAVALFIGFFGLAGAWAQEEDNPGDTVSTTRLITPASGLEGVNNHLAQLEKRTVVLSVEHDYLDLSDSEEDLILKIGGVVQEDYRAYFGPTSSYYDYVPIGQSPYFEQGATAPVVGKSTSTFLNRKTRLDLIAIFGHLVGLRYQAELGATGYAIQDAYVFVKAGQAFQFQAGKFKVPVGLERLQNDTDNLFIERALPTDLVPNRDLGFEVTGTPLDGLNYAVALTSGTPDNYAPNNADDQSLINGKEVSARVFLIPFVSGDSFIKGLGFGLSGAWAWNVSWNTNAYPNYFITSLGQQQFFAYRTGVFPQGDFNHWAPQFYFYTGSFGLLAEYVQTLQPVGTGTVNIVTLTHRAWQVAASWVIGGKASYLGAVADQSLDLRKGHWGALEVAARVHQLAIDPGAFSPLTASNLAATNSAQQATAYGLGFNWIFNPHFKLILDWEETRFLEGAQVSPAVPGTLSNLNPEDVLTVRGQANF